MKKIRNVFILVGFLILGIFTLLSQEEKKNPDKEIGAEMEEKNYFSYNPRGRRDPFRNLLAGRDVKEKALVGGMPEISIDDITLVGIIKARGKYTAVINGPQEFPFFIKVGDKFSDGSVLSIKESQVVFRKTKERGILLIIPKDIVKALSPEEL